MQDILYNYLREPQKESVIYRSSGQSCNFEGRMHVCKATRKRNVQDQNTVR